MQVVHWKLMCQYVPMCPHVSNGLIHTYNLWDWLFIVTPCVCMCPNVPNDLSHIFNLQYWLSMVNLRVIMWPWTPMWAMVWYTPITSETGCSLWAHYVFNTIHYYNLWDKCSLWSYMSLCKNSLQYLLDILYSLAVNTSHLAVGSGSICANLCTA